MALVTYDVFDTAITRLVGNPATVFLMLGQRAVAGGSWRGSAEQLAAARVVAETRARSHASRGEVTLGEIYEEFKNAYALDSAELSAFIALELSLERQLIRAVPEIMTEIVEARRSGNIVQFVSDMYLPHDILRSWLIELEVMKNDEVLWVSSLHGQTKHDGHLFEMVRMAQPQKLLPWIHHGDSAHSDVRVPMQRGIQARHYVRCHLTANERAMDDCSSETCGLSSLLAGAARWTRLQQADAAAVGNDDVASGVVAPVIYAYVLWLLLEARRRGLSRLWFMARDGQVMLAVARAIARRLNIPIELGYLYGGRQIVRVASLTQIDEHALDWLTAGAGVVTLQSILDRVGLSVDDVTEVATSLGVPVTDAIGWSRVPQLRLLLRHPDVTRRILKEAAARRAVVLEYFRGCGLLDGTSCGVVDIGWRGNVLRSFVDLVGIEQASQHTFMYFGCYGQAKGCEAVPKAAYLFDICDGKALGTGADIPSMTTLMEIFCQADHGPVMSLERHDTGFRPVSRARNVKNVINSGWSVEKVQTAVAYFAETVPIELAGDLRADLRSMCDRLLRRLATEPTASEVKLLGAIEFVDDQAGAEAQPFAHSYRWANLRLAFRTTQASPPLGMIWWTAAAVRLTPMPLRWCMRAAATAGLWRTRRRERRLSNKSFNQKCVY